MTANAEAAYHYEQLDRYLCEQHVTVTEGYVSPEQAQPLGKLAANRDMRKILEVGFNAGHSALTFLAANPEASVVSFDLGRHGCVAWAKKYIDAHFPGRHQLVLGDSRRTVPDFHRKYPTYACDLAFIDGGHRLDVAGLDIRNVRNMAHAGTTLVVDDIVPWRTCGVGPSLAWSAARLQGMVKQQYLVQDGRQVACVLPPALQAFAVGRYVYEDDREY